jgi:hypothetical protein
MFFLTSRHEGNKNETNVLLQRYDQNRYRCMWGCCPCRMSLRAQTIALDNFIIGPFNSTFEIRNFIIPITKGIKREERKVAVVALIICADSEKSPNRLNARLGVPSRLQFLRELFGRVETLSDNQGLVSTYGSSSKPEKSVMFSNMLVQIVVAVGRPAVQNDPRLTISDVATTFWNPSHTGTVWNQVIEPTSTQWPPQNFWPSRELRVVGKGHLGFEWTAWISAFPWSHNISRVKLSNLVTSCWINWWNEYRDFDHGDCLYIRLVA